MKKNLLIAAMLLCAYNLQAAKLFYKDETKTALQSGIRAKKWAVKKADSTIAVVKGRIGQCKARIGEIKESMKFKTPTVQTKYQGTVDKLNARIETLQENLKVARKKRSTYAKDLTMRKKALKDHPRSAGKTTKSAKPKKVKKVKKAKVKKHYGKTKRKYKKKRHGMLPDETRLY